jgi:transposase
MRGKDDRSEILFSYIRLDERIPADHPLRVIRQLVDAALAELSRAFAKLYARDGRPSIPPERLLRALLLQAFYTVRSELQLMEQLNYNLLFRWFIGLSADDPVWDATVFCKNRDRLLNGDIARKFMISVLNLPEVRHANAAARRTSRRTTPIAGRRSMRARLAIPAIASARLSANASKNLSGG